MQASSNNFLGRSELEGGYGVEFHSKNNKVVAKVFKSGAFLRKCTLEGLPVQPWAYENLTTFAKSKIDQCINEGNVQFQRKRSKRMYHVECPEPKPKILRPQIQVSELRTDNEEERDEINVHRAITSHTSSLSNGSSSNGSLLSSTSANLILSTTRSGEKPIASDAFVNPERSNGANKKRVYSRDLEHAKMIATIQKTLSDKIYCSLDDFLKGNLTNRENLDFSFLNLTDRDIEDLINKLSDCSHGFSLDLQGNEITSTGVRLLCSIPHLTSLDISHNPIGDEGAILLANGEYIKKLTANFCDIGYRGASAFLNSTVLEDLWLIANEFDQDQDEWINKINDVLYRNRARRDPIFQREFETRRLREELESKVMKAIKEENIAELRTSVALLEEGVNTQLEYGCNLLFYALDNNSNHCVEALLKMGARVEDKDDRDKTALFTAAEKGMLAIVRLLLKYGGNITGEFYFNGEDALSIAAFKFCDPFIYFLNINRHRGPNFNRMALHFIRFWDKLWKLDTPTWQIFAEDDVLEFAADCLALFKSLREKRPDLIGPSINNRAEVFDAIQEKFRIIKEKAPSTDLDECPTDEDENLELIHKIDPVLKPSKDFRNLSQDQLQEYIERLNVELKEGKNEAEIDWTKYPRFFIVQFRGVHYYRHHFSKHQRADHRSTAHLNRIAPAAAAYQISELTPTQHQLARESTIKKSVQIIRNTFEELREDSTEAKQYWEGKKRTFNNKSDMMQQRMSNSYEGYKQDIANPSDPASQLIAERKILGYPHYATSDLPMHALRYVFGQKKIDGLDQWRLRPVFQENGKAFHPYPGKLLMTMFTPLQMHSHHTRHVAGMHNRKEINLKGTIAPERETSMPGGVEAEVSFYEELMQIPSFEHYRQDYEEKYGITENDFYKFKEGIASSWTHENEEQRNKLRKKVKNEIIAKIIEHKENQLLYLAQEEARHRGGYLIFRHHEGTYGMIFEKMRIPSRGAPSYTRREEVIREQLLCRTAIFNTNDLTLSSSSDFNHQAQKKPLLSDEDKFVTERTAWTICKTVGDGACAQHAVLGEQTDRGYFFQPSSGISCRVDFCNRLRELVSENGFQNERIQGAYLDQMRSLFQDIGEALIRMIKEGKVSSVNEFLQCYPFSEPSGNALVIFKAIAPHIERFLDGVLEESQIIKRKQDIILPVVERLNAELTTLPVGAIDSPCSLLTFSNFCHELKKGLTEANPFDFLFLHPEEMETRLTEIEKQEWDEKTQEEVQAIRKAIQDILHCDEEQEERNSEKRELSTKLALEVIEQYLGCLLQRNSDSWGYWFSHNEMIMIAHLYNINIKIYEKGMEGTPICREDLGYNIQIGDSCDTVHVFYNGIDHYEKME